METEDPHTYGHLPKPGDITVGIVVSRFELGLAYLEENTPDRLTWISAGEQSTYRCVSRPGRETQLSEESARSCSAPAEASPDSLCAAKGTGSGLSGPLTNRCQCPCPPGSSRCENPPDSLGLSRPDTCLGRHCVITSETCGSSVHALCRPTPLWRANAVVNVTLASANHNIRGNQHKSIHIVKKTTLIT